ncbi:MAG TPA: hypothetical protein VFO41_09340 [Alphaproteobacteria bacterium]|nr:hypothetical protein [Alphaproteobacteria bacterium]
MNGFLKLIGGGQVYIEFARWARPDRWFEARIEGRELILWFGRLCLIYTPRSWSPREGSLPDGRQRAYGR